MHWRELHHWEYGWGLDHGHADCEGEDHGDDTGVHDEALPESGNQFSNLQKKEKKLKK